MVIKKKVIMNYVIINKPFFSEPLSAPKLDHVKLLEQLDLTVNHL